MAIHDIMILCKCPHNTPHVHQVAGQAIHSRKCGLYLGGGATYARKAWILSWDMLGLGPVMKLQKKNTKNIGVPGTQREEPIIFHILPYKHTIGM